MEISNWVTEAEVLRVLNVEPPTPSSYARFLERFSKGSAHAPLGGEEGLLLLHQWEKRKVSSRRAGFIHNYLANAPFFEPPPGSPERGWQLPPTLSRQESKTFSAALTSAHLRIYVDEWLKTGQHADGSELVAERDVVNSLTARNALWGYLQHAPPKFQPATSKDGLRLIIADPTGYRGPVRDFFEAQIVSAKRLFAGIIVSDWKEGLCKCRYSPCGRYFQRSRPRKCYKRGTFCCHKHLKANEAAAAMVRSRSAGAETLIEEAAKKLLAWGTYGHEWMDDNDLKRRLAAELCLFISRKRLHRYRQEVKVNWVTRHQPRIEKGRIELFENVGTLR